MIQIRSLKKIGLDVVYDAWNDAFSEYIRSWTKDELDNMFNRRCYDPALSFGAFDGDMLVAFTLNGTHVYNGKRTAYDVGTGTRKAYEGKGLAKEIFRYSVPFLQEAGLQQYILEVLQDNAKAISVYTKIGFKAVRGLDFFVEQKDAVTLKTKALPVGYELREIDLKYKAVMESLWDFKPSWQNQFFCLENKPDNFKVIGVFNGEELVGYSILEMHSGDVPQMAVATTYRRKGIGTAILAALLSHDKHSTIRFINIDDSCTDMRVFMEAHGMAKKGAQYEMVYEL